MVKNAILLPSVSSHRKITFTESDKRFSHFQAKGCYKGAYKTLYTNETNLNLNISQINDHTAMTFD